MRKITFCEATLEAMREEMKRDNRVFVMGEDIARQGGIFGQFAGLAEEFGTERVRDTPISETSIVGGGVGAALAGMRPVVDMHFADFLGVAMDEVFNQMAKARYMSGGQARVPVEMCIRDSHWNVQCNSWFFTFLKFNQRSFKGYIGRNVFTRSISRD